VHNLEIEAVVCGEAVGLLRDRPTAESIASSMVADVEELLRRGGTLDFASQQWRA
jgi:nitronate monooxygenase